MPIGNHLARCHNCGKQWIVGDCIPSICPECECKRRGHLAIAGTTICGRCGVRVNEHCSTYRSEADRILDQDAWDI